MASAAPSIPHTLLPSALETVKDRIGLDGAGYHYPPLQKGNRADLWELAVWETTPLGLVAPLLQSLAWVGKPTPGAWRSLDGGRQQEV